MALKTVFVAILAVIGLPAAFCDRDSPVMAGYAAAAIAAVQLVQATLLSLQTTLGFGAYLCPVSTSIDTITSISAFDYVIIGGGEAGSIIASRLSEFFPGSSVLVIEAGGCPPLESNMPGYFPLLPLSSYDYGMNIYNDSYSAQNLVDGAITIGKMLGGTGSLGHMIYDSPQPDDYDRWATAANDSSWGFEEFSKYFIKGENVQHEGVLAQNPNHGTSGPTILTKQENPLMADVIAAYNETGISYKEDAEGIYVTQPLLMVGEQKRQSGNVAYLSKILNRTNVYFLTDAVVTKILFNGTTATGVQFTYNGETYNASASNNVIVAGGAIKSPQILQLSGIGDANALTELGIDVVVNITEVGQNLMDRVGVLVGLALDASDVAAPAANPYLWPLPAVTASDAINSTTKPERLDIVAYIPPNSSGLLQLCTYGLKYTNEICDAFYEYNMDRNFALGIISLLDPKSRGSVKLNTKDINDQPIVDLGLLRDTSDLETFAPLLKKFTDLLDTDALQNLGAEFADIGICKDHKLLSLEYLKCYIVEMSMPRWQFSGSNAIGKVVDGSLSAYGTEKLKVVDASVFPHMTSGNISPTVRAIAEKASDIIIAENCNTRPWC